MNAETINIYIKKIPGSRRWMNSLDTRVCSFSSMRADFMGYIRQVYERAASYKQCGQSLG
jgi:hypothetical protein